jgi:uncharacterized protein (TIGR02271 family)
MTKFTEAYDFEGRTLIDRDGEKLGKVEELYMDDRGGQPEWALVHSGLFGTKKTFVPLHGAEPVGEDARVPIRKAQVKDAPHIDAGGRLSEEEEQRLFEHYGVPYTTEGTTTATGAPGSTGRGDRDTRRGAGHDVSGPDTDDAMTRSEEQLRVGTERAERGRARLRKYVVTEQVTKTVPVSREEVRLEREPITDANVDAATEGPAISDEEHEVVLHEERPVVEKQTVPKERVRVETETVTDQQDVSEEVRRERIETDGVDERR